MFFELFSYVEGIVNPIKVDAPIKVETVAELAKDLANGSVVQVDADVDGELAVSENEFQADKDFGNPVEGDGAWKSFSSIGEEFMQGGVLNRNVPNVATYSIGATVVEKHHNPNPILKMANGGGVEVSLRKRFDGYTDEELKVYNGENEETLKSWNRKGAIDEAIRTTIEENYAQGGEEIKIGDMAKLTDPDGFLFEQSFDNLKHAKRFADSFTPTIYRGLVRSDYEIIVVKEDEEYAVYYRLKNRPKTRMGKRVYAKGGGVGEKFKAGDYVFAKASRFDTSIKDESAKIPFFVSHWSHDKYYVLGDGSHYISEGELTHATEKDFNDYYGENASEGYKHILEEGGEIGEYIVDGRITILGEDGSQRVRINETAFATSEDNAVDKVIAKYENIYGVDESEMEVDLYANKNYDKGGIVFDEKLKERLLSKKVINVGDKFLLPNMEITPSEFSDLIDKHLANRTKIGLYEYEVMGLYLNNMDGSERISLKWIGKHGKGYSSVDTYLDTFNTIRVLLRYYDIMWKTHG